MKRGFTLVELLAVIAILAILVIIALPNVLNLFNDAKKSSFQTEVQTIYNTAQQEFLLGGGKAVEYYRSGGNACLATGTTLKSLSLKGTSTVDYYIKIDANGNIVEYHVADDAFAFTYTGTIGLKIEEIGKEGNEFIIKDEDSEQYNNVQLTLSGKCHEIFWYTSCVPSSNNLNCKIINAEQSLSDENIDFSQISSATNGNGLYYTSDLSLTEDYDGNGTGDRVYYYRGAVTNNNVRFGGYCWRIVRTNEDGSVKLRYNGEFTNGTCPTTGTDVKINNTTYSFYGSRNNGKYNEYIWEDGTGESLAKTTIDAWYTSSGLERYADKIANVPYCADKSNPTKPTTGSYTSYTYYGSANRLADYSGSSLTAKSDAQPTYKCQDNEDKHTVSGDSWDGNEKLTKPIGLLTADEVVFAGGKIASGNSSYYLYTSSNYWLISPFSGTSSIAYSFRVVSTGYIGSNSVNSALRLLPVISLKSNVAVKAQGDGSYTNPYVVE